MLRRVSFALWIGSVTTACGYEESGSSGLETAPAGDFVVNLEAAEATTEDGDPLYCTYFVRERYGQLRSVKPTPSFAWLPATDADELARWNDIFRSTFQYRVGFTWSGMLSLFVGAAASGAGQWYVGVPLMVTGLGAGGASEHMYKQRLENQLRLFERHVEDRSFVPPTVQYPSASEFAAYQRAGHGFENFSPTSLQQGRCRSHTAKYLRRIAAE